MTKTMTNREIKDICEWIYRAFLEALATSTITYVVSKMFRRGE